MIITRNGAVGLLSAWAIFTASAFWWRVGRYMRPVPPPQGAAVMRAGSLPNAPVTLFNTDSGAIDLHDGQKATLLNFWSPDCPCSRFMETHVDDLVRRFGAQGVVFVTVVQTGDTDSEAAEGVKRWRSRGIDVAAVADRGGALARMFGVWAAPAAVVVDGHGRIAFVGAYNAARYCANKETAFAENALSAVVANRPPALAVAPFYGCQVTPGRP